MEPRSPYPGLRPFEVDEAHLFFGREEQTDDLLQRLHATRFLAVVGPSGCGKSSLVRAGMIASLGAGFMVAAGSRWRIAVMRPESRPMHSLAAALVEKTALGEPETDKEIAIGFLEATLRRGPLGVVEVLRDTPLPPDTNLLILVDQFEEIFRFEREGGSDEADAFVSLLLETARQREMPIYVVITMRSDFFGDCAIFEGLPEALNESQYLTPRLTRAQRQDAITGPAAVFGGSIAPDLVNHLLNRMGTDPDQLPLMQHLLMRMWTRRFPGAAGAAEPIEHIEIAHAGGERELTLADCEAVGGLEHALSRHADEAYESLDDRQREIAETLFRLLSERAPGNRDIRHPTPAGEIAELAGASLAELVAVVDAFRAPGRSFIVPAYPEPIDAARVLDITHESLIRQWERLREWAEEEGKAAATYRDLAGSASQWKEGQSALWQSPDLERGLDWRRREQPTALWAERYGGDFRLAMEFLAESEKARAARQAEAAARRRAQIRRWRWATGSATALVLLLLGGSFYVYKAKFADDVRYYNSFAKKFGEPFGIGELRPDQVAHRASSLRLVRHGFLSRVTRIEAVDADGNCTPFNNVGTYFQDQQGSTPLHECRWEFVYDDNGQVIYEKAYDKEGHLQWGYSYAPSEEAKKSRIAYYVGRDGFAPRFKNSRAELVSFEYSPEGYERRETWKDRENKPQPAKDNAYGRDLQYDREGRTTRMTSLDQNGRKMNDTAGNATLVLSYDALGDATDARALDKDGKPAITKSGWAEDKIAYDANGNQISEAFFDDSGQPTVDSNGVHLIKVEYDAKGREREVGYYGIDGKPTINKDGYHRKVILSRDAHGNVLQWAFFGIGGAAATDSRGVHEYRETYDSRGFGKSMAFFDRQEKPTAGDQGYHKVEWQYDAQGNKIWESYFDRTGRPTRDNDGWYRLKLAYDHRGNVIEWSDFGADGQPIVTNSGYHRKTDNYDDFGNVIEEAYFGANGEPVNRKSGGFGNAADSYHIIKATYDPRGNQKEISYFDVKGNPVVGSEGFARRKREYDPRDNITKSAYYGPDGSPSEGNRGYALLHKKYDNHDRIIEEAFFGDDGKLKEGADGAAIIGWRYQDNREEERYFNAAGEPISLEGCALHRSILDRRSGKRIETACLDAPGRTARSNSGAAIVRMQYDNHGREIEWASFDQNQNLVSSPNYAIRRYKYDDHGNRIEEAFYGSDGKLRPGPDSYAIFRSKYNDHGKQIEIAYYGPDGKPQLQPRDGYASASGNYDEEGHLTEFAKYGEDGQLKAGPDGDAGFRVRYNDHGGRIEFTSFDENRRPIVRRKYDNQGNEIEIAYFDKLGNLRLSPMEGYAMLRKKFDKSNRMTETEYFGDDGKLRVNQKEGYAAARLKYDDRGNNVEVAYFGADGKPLIDPQEGYATTRMKYDGHGRMVEETYFDEAGKLRDNADGYATERDVYDDHGKLQQRVYLGPDGELLNLKTGFAMAAKSIVAFDQAHHIVAQCLDGNIDDFSKAPKGCFGADGKPLASHPIILRVFPLGHAEEIGLQSGDMIEAYDGKPVFSYQELRSLIEQPGKEQRRIDIVRQGRQLVFEAPPGLLGVNLGIGFVPANQPVSAESTSSEEAPHAR